MLHRGHASARGYEAQMLAAADRLFTEFDALPILTVVRSINDARSGLRAGGVRPSPPAIEAAAHDRLVQIAARLPARAAQPHRIPAPATGAPPARPGPVASALPGSRRLSRGNAPT